MESLKPLETSKLHTKREPAPQVDAPHARGPQTLQGDALQAVGGGYPCGYLGIEDWGLMMCYYSRQYSC